MDADRNDKVHLPDETERPAEAEILTGDTSYQPGRTIEPWEEGDAARGFQHGSWSYDEPQADREGVRNAADLSDDPNDEG